MNSRYFFLILGGLLLFRLTSFSQESLSEVDLNRVPFKKVRKYLHNQQHKMIQCFDDLAPSCSDDQDFTEFNVVENSYIVKKQLSDVWKMYCSVSPVEVWNGKIVAFGFMYSRQSKSLSYRNDNCEGVETGQILYLNMKLLKGIYNLALAFEIIKVDTAGKIIEFSYLTYGKAKGMQKIQLYETPEGYTKIIHITYFRSNSSIRDKFLYPFFHKKAITEFHNNIRKKLAA